MKNAPAGSSISRLNRFSIRCAPMCVSPTSCDGSGWLIDPLQRTICKKIIGRGNNQSISASISFREPSQSLHSSYFESIQRFPIAVISSRVQQLLPTAVILAVLAVVKPDGTAIFASDLCKYPKEKRMRNLSFVKRMTALAMALMFLVASNVTRVEAAPVNNLTPEQIEAIATNMFNKFAAMDAQGTASLFAANGTIEDPVGTTPIQGTQAIIAYLETFPTILDEIRIQSFDVTVAGQEAALKWRLRFKTKSGNVFFVDGIGILKINEDGKVQSDREYFDLAYFQAQLQQ